MDTKLTVQQAAAVRNALRDVRVTEARVIDSGGAGHELREQVEEVIRARQALKRSLRSAREAMG